MVLKKEKLSTSMGENMSFFSSEKKGGLSSFLFSGDVFFRRPAGILYLEASRYFTMRKKNKKNTQGDLLPRRDCGLLLCKTCCPFVIESSLYRRRSSAM